MSPRHPLAVGADTSDAALINDASIPGAPVLSLVGKEAAQIGADLPTVGELRRVVPKHCFERSVATSFYYVARDGAMIATFAYLASFLPVDNLLNPLVALAWLAYAFWQGTAVTGWWVIAHECGHGAFSDYPALNNAVGLVLHTMMYVPYYSWQYSHAKHHSKTNHLLDGETHNPPNMRGFKKVYQPVFNFLGEDGFAAFQIWAHLFLGWPMYLLLNESGSRRLHDGERIPKGEVLDHFRPWSKLFPEAWRARIAVSTLAIFAWSYVLWQAASVYGGKRVFLMYWGPYFFTNAWLVGYTWLQHSDEGIPQFGEDQWTWIKGAALGTVDRPYGIFDWFHHHIGSTHVFHHLFSYAPHYHAVEATAHLKAKLGDNYNYVDAHWTESLVRVAKKCHYVNGVEGVQYYTSIGANKSKSQ